ncbi:MAG: tetratricopeptide repeat protein [Desulfomonilia bacterium]
MAEMQGDNPITSAQTPKRYHRSLCFEVLICLLLAGVIFFVYWQVTSFDFINFDDEIYIENNHSIEHGINFESIKWAFSSFGYASNWYPMTWISHMLDIQLFGMHPGMHHLTSVIFHILNTILLLIVLDKMTGSLWKSTVVAALFALHPLHVESVAWISERKDVLSTFFWMLTMLSYYWYVQHRSSHRYIIVVLIYILGLLSKPMLVTLPFVLFLLDFWPLKRWGFDQSLHTNTNEKGKIHTDVWRSRRSFLIIEKIPLIMLALISSGVTFYTQRKFGAMIALADVQFGTRISNAITSYVIYLRNMIWPFNLSIVYPYPDAFNPLLVILHALLLLCISAFVLFSSRRYPYLVVGWLWYIGTLVPVIGIVQVGEQSMADRYTYIPLIGIFIMVVWGLVDLHGHFRYRKVALGVTSIIVLALLAWCAWVQVGFWNNSETIFRHALNITKNNYVVHRNLGEALLIHGDNEGAIRQYQEYLCIKPNSIEVHTILGDTLLREGNLDEAIMQYLEVLRINPHKPEIFNNLGTAYLLKGNIKKAIKYFRESVHYKPDYATAMSNLKVAIAQLKLLDLISNIQSSMKADPQNPTLHMRLGEIYHQQGEYDKAITQYQEAISIHPKFIKAMNGLVLIYSSQQEFTKALDVLQSMRQIEPNSPDVYYNIACIYAKQNMTKESIGWLNQAINKGFKNWELIKRDPDLANIRNTAFINELMKNH